MKSPAQRLLERQQLLTRRGVIIGAVQFGVIGTLGMRMKQMQLDRADSYRTLADGNSIKIRLLAPARGLIQDRHGQIIAGNEQNYRVTVTAEEAGDISEIIARLRRIIPMSDMEAARLITKIKASSPITPVSIADRLDWETFSAIAVNAPALPGVTPEAVLSRVYPRSGDFSHALGYVGRVSSYDLSRIEDPDPLLHLPDFQLGKRGMEAKEEAALRGRAGIRRIEVNVHQREMRELTRQEGKPGATLQSTLDTNLQAYTRQRLGDDSAAAVVIEIETGDIHAIASSPVFDPNKFVHGISVADYRALTEHPYRPLADKSVQGLYPPGSTFKMVTLLAGLESGLVSPDDHFYCNGAVEISGRKFHCWSRGGHGMVGPVESLRRSCDVYYYEIAQKVGIDRMAAMARRLGIGVDHDLPMSAVATGTAPDKTWKKQRYEKDWLIGDTINAAIGQGYVLASPMQLAVMTARIASGKAVEPRLIRARDGVPEPAPEFADLGIPDQVLKYARAGMDAVINDARGTAHKSRIVNNDWRMAGKTGTSQVRNITAAERARGVVSNSQLPWDRRDHALFVSYAPVEAPRFAVSVVVEHGGGGSTAAAPVARDIMLFALHGGLPPLSAYPSSQRAEIKERHDKMDLPQGMPSGGDTERVQA